MRSVFWLALVGTLLGSLADRSEAAARFYPEDATIRAIHFADEKEGWAVGDDGVIWHTINAGQTWERQSSGIRASLRAVHFLTPYTGWIVGRMELPDGASRGIVLSTTDGGLKWDLLSTDRVPGLHWVKFVNDRNGIALGEGSDGYPSGVYYTIDRGATWKAIPGKRSAAWLAGDFSDPNNGILAGYWGQLATVRDGFFGAAQVDPIGNRAVRSMKLDGNRAVAVGQGGLIMTSTRSAGLKWGFVDLPLSKDVLANCDFHSVAIHGKHLWVVGRPGTIILHSADQGQNWEVQRTHQHLPLHSVHFASETDGWAAGELGTILRTRDGGKTWKIQRQGMQRAAVLFIHSNGTSVPLETAALLAGEEGYSSVALSVLSSDLNVPRGKDASETERLSNQLRTALAKEAPEAERLAGTMRFLGGTSAEACWQFPVPLHLQEGNNADVLAYWDQIHGERGTTQLLRQLVLAIRIWRPELIITDPMDGENKHTRSALIAEAVKEAFRLAGDSEAFPEQLQKLHLATWEAKKVCIPIPRIDPTAITVDARKVRIRLMDSPRELAAEAMPILNPQGHVPAERSYRILATRLSDTAGHTELMQGITLAPGGQARRVLPTSTLLDRQIVSERDAAVRKRSNMEAFLRGEAGPVAQPEQLLADLIPTTKAMPPDLAARTAFGMARQYEDMGQWLLAREAYSFVVARYPTQPVALEAARWLIRFHSSSEARRRQQLRQFYEYSITEFEKAGDQKGPIRNKTQMTQTSVVGSLEEPMTGRKWYEAGLGLESCLAMHGPLFARDPAMQFCLQSARRRLGNAEAATKWFMGYVQTSAIPTGSQPLTRGADPWRDAAASEIWLSTRSSTVKPPKPLVYSPKITERPKLDGKLDDTCWEHAEAVSLATVSGTPKSEYATTAKILFDDQYLYLAVKCSHPQGKQLPTSEKRKRDEDLRGYDRVSFLLDLDRDYQTYYQFVVDQRGCLWEDCWGDRSWNPTWYVAAHSEPTSWTAEIAIPLGQIATEAPLPGDVWAFNAVRIIPGEGIQAWSSPADNKPRPEGMGLLHFVEKR